MAFQQHSREVLSRLQAEIPETVKSGILQRLGQDQPKMLADELAGVYVPVARLIQQRLDAVLTLRKQNAAALGAPLVVAPFIIGLAGSVAVGKSTAAKLLQLALAGLPGISDVELVTSDGFLFSLAELEQRGILERKGFPESFDRDRLIDFLLRLKSGETGVSAPLYSHLTYDVMPDQGQVIHSPQIVIVEGINVLQTYLPDAARNHALPSDFFDYSVYVHADEPLIKQWFTERFLALTEAAVNDPSAFYARFAPLSAAQRLGVVDFVWKTINARNLYDHILPTRARADLILHKGADHVITHFEIRNR